MPGEAAPFPTCHRAAGWGLGHRDKPVPPREAATTGDPAEQQVPLPSRSPRAHTLSTGSSALCIIQTLFPGRDKGDGKRTLHSPPPFSTHPGMFSCTPGCLLPLPNRAGK